MKKQNNKRRIKRKVVTQEECMDLQSIKYAQREKLQGLNVNIPHDWYWTLLRYSRAYLEGKGK